MVLRGLYKGLGMPELRTYNLFISHSWSYSNAYERLTDFFKEHSNFDWKNYSVPQDDPIHKCGTDRQLEDAIREQIKHATCVVILAGVYATYSKWINKEIRIAKELDKPIVAVQPWGAEKTSKIVKDNADIIAGWNSDSIVDAIRKLAK